MRCTGIFAAENNPLNGIVKLEVHKSAPNNLAPWQQVMNESSGSGVVIENRRILTNAHNVANSSMIMVRKHNTDAIYTAKVEFVDHDCDLATLRVKEPEFYDDITPFEIGETPQLQSEVLAIGYPIGGNGLSMTKGIVSRIENRLYAHSFRYLLAVQLDAAINPGNSGGALLNMQGELIGINSAKAAATEVEGMGYAIPVSVAQPILDELMNRETRYKADEDHAGYIGVTCLNVDSTSAQTYGIPLGAFVDSVEEGGPAQTAGIQKGDVIVKFDGMTVSGSSDLVGKLEYYQAGETVEVVISRAQNGEYQEQTVSVTLGKKSEMKQADPQQGK